MKHFRKHPQIAGAAFALAGLISTYQTSANAQAAQPSTFQPSTFARVGSVDERFQSYNIEMVEVIGGRFWKPYASKAAAPRRPKSANQPAGLDPGLFRTPPAHRPHQPPPPQTRRRARSCLPPRQRHLGQHHLLSGHRRSRARHSAQRLQRRAHPRRMEGRRRILQSRRRPDRNFLRHRMPARATIPARGLPPRRRSSSTTPNPSAAPSPLRSSSTSPPSPSAAASRRLRRSCLRPRFAVFQPFIRKASPDMIFLGPGCSRRRHDRSRNMQMLSSTEMLDAIGPSLRRLLLPLLRRSLQPCAPCMGAAATTTARRRTDRRLAHPHRHSRRLLRRPARQLRPRQTHLAHRNRPDSLRWRPLGLHLPRQLPLPQPDGPSRQTRRPGHLHNTLAASDYGLLDEKTYVPRPNYWAALLWHNPMGTTVLDPGASPAPSLHSTHNA